MEEWEAVAAVANLAAAEADRGVVDERGAEWEIRDLRLEESSLRHMADG